MGILASRHQRPSYHATQQKKGTTQLRSHDDTTLFLFIICLLLRGGGNLLGLFFQCHATPGLVLAQISLQTSPGNRILTNLLRRQHRRDVRVRKGRGNRSSSGNRSGGSRGRGRC